MTDLGTLGIQGNGFFESNVNDVLARGARIGTRADDQAVDSGLGVERLRPEKTDNYDFGLQVRSARVVLEASGFWIRLNNTIVSQTLLLPQGAVGQVLGDQVITRQLATGAVFVPIATQPVLVRANFTGARLQGFEQRLQAKIRRDVTFEENLTYIYAEDAKTGLAPDIEPGSPPTMANFRLRWVPGGRRFWTEAYSTVADRQRRIPSISIADRRTGANRSRTNIANFFNNGARVRGLVANGILIPTGETLGQVQNRVLGSAASAPLYSAIPGWATVGVRAGLSVGERSDLFLDFSNLGDKNYRGLGWGMDGAGRSVTVKWRVRF
jgi:hemoglobin/transferrin/lactoferrin receptor protein